MSAKQYGIPTPIQFDRLYAGPLDKHEVFDSYSEALTYAQGPISYPGQTIGVKKSGLKEDVYVINQDKSLSRLMIQREDIRVVLKHDLWVGECPYEQTVSVPYLEDTDNCIISLGESVTDPEIVKQIVQAKIADTIQQEGSIKFIARGSIPEVDIPVTITIGSVVSAVEIPNNVNDNTNHTVVIAKKDAWKGTKPPYTQDLYVFGVRPDSNGTIGINPDSSYAQIDKMTAATCGVKRYEQRNNYVTIAAMNSKPTRDLEILVVWGDEIVVFENSDTLEDFNTSVDLILKANDWTDRRPYTQTLRVEGLSEYHTGAIGLSDNCTPEEAEIGLNAGLKLIEQGNGYIIVEATDIKPTVDLPVYLTYGANITIVPSPEYVGEANRHVDAVAYASKWTKVPDGWEQEIEVEGITSNSIGSMGLRNGCTELQSYNASIARIKITKVYDNKVLLTATRVRPAVNIPLSFVFGRNFNLIKYPGVIGKVTLDCNYIIFDDSLINSGLTTLQQLLEYIQKIKVNKADISDRVHDGSLMSGFETKKYIPEETDPDWSLEASLYKPLSARMGRYLFLRKINYDDIVDNTTSTFKDQPLSARMGKHLEDVKINYDDIVDNLTTPDNRKPLSANMGKTLNDDLQAHKNTSTIHVPTVNGGDGKYLMYNNSANGDKEWHTLNIDGVNAGSNGDMIHYSTCATAAATAAKVVSASGFKLITGSTLNIKFTVTNTASNPTLNINGTGAKAIFYKGSAISAEKLVANRLYTFIYDGTNYVLVGDITTYEPSKTIKAYITGTSNSNTTTDPDQVFDSDVYMQNSIMNAKGFNAGSRGITSEGDITSEGYLSGLNLDSNTIIKIQSSQPAAISGKNIIWIKI